MLLDDVLGQFLVQLEANGRSQHTIGQYRRHIGALAQWLGGTALTSDVGEIRHQDLARFLTSKDALERPDGKAKRGTSVNTLRSSVRTFFAFAHQAGYVPENAARLLRRAVCSPPLPRALSQFEQERLLSALAKGKGPAASRDYALFGFLLATGVRLASALALDVKDVDLHAGEVTLRTCKGGRAQRVFLGRAILDHLRAYVGERRSGLLFSGQAGGKLSARHVQRRLSIWLKAAGIERHASPHSLRHTYATTLYRRTKDLLLVQRALGHRSVGSTMRYAQVDDERLRAAVAS